MMESKPGAAAPVAASERIQGLDATRGIAVLGILLMNIWSFAGPVAFFDYPIAVADWGGAPVVTWAIVHTLFEGSQRALFSMLFGAGMVLMVSRLEAADPATPVRRIYYRRIGLLMLIGLFDSMILLWPADILLTYALCGLVLYPLRRLRAHWLLLLALLVFGTQAGLRYSGWLDDTEAHQTWIRVMEQQTPVDQLDPDTAAQLEAWKKLKERAQPDVHSEQFRESMRIMSSGSFSEFVAERLKSSLILQTVVLMNSWLLDALGAMLLGMALFRSGLLTLAASPRTYLLMAAAGYLVGLPLSLFETTSLLRSGFDPLVHSQLLIFYDLRRIAISFGHLGLILWWCRIAPGHWLVRRLAAVGRMALSNYLGQSILGGLIFYSIGFGLYGKFTGYYLYLVVLGIWLFQIAFSNWWLSRFRFGPAEWIWRSLTYGKRQPMAR